MVTWRNYYSEKNSKVLRFFWLTYIFIIWAPLLSHSQNLSDLERRELINGAIGFLDDEYLNYCDYSTSDNYQFKRLFVSDDLLIANDVLPDNNLDSQIKVKDYHFTLPKYYNKSMLSNKLKYLGISSIERKGGFFLLKISTEKRISGYTKNGINYSDSLKLDFTIRCIPSNNSDLFFTYKIESIQIIEDYGKYLLIYAESKSFLMKPFTLIDTSIIYLNNKKEIKLDLNKEGYKLLKRAPNNLTFKANNYENPFYVPLDISNSSPYSSDPNGRKISFKVHPFYVHLNGNFTPNFQSQRLLNISALDNIETQNILAASGNLAFGARVFNAKRIGINLEFGGSYSTYNYQFNIDNTIYTYDAEDPDNYQYIREISVTDYNEDINLSFYSYNFLLNPFLKISKKIRLNLLSGIELFQSIQTNSEVSANANYTGYYEDLFQIRISENGVYDFGNYSLEDNSSLELTKNLWSYNFGGGLEHNITPKTIINFFILKKVTTNPIFNKKDKLITTESNEINSITSLSNDIYLNQLTLGLGLKYKL